MAGPPGAIAGALALLLAPGAVAELRAIGREGGVASGYFDDPALLAEKADALDAAGQHSGIYVTLNPVEPSLLARRANRVVPRLGGRDPTTADADILARRWLPVDVDPVRASGIAATETEREAALGVAAAIRDALAAEGWPAPVLADSGNGAHLLYRIDLPNDDDATALVRGVLAALDFRFSTDAATVDCANHNAARIWKVYGTVSRKGDHVPGREHRRAAVLEAPPAPAVVPADLLRTLATPSPAPAPPAPADLRAWLESHGIAVASEKPWQGGTLYALEACPFSDAHRDGAYVVRFENGAVRAGCHHDSCGAGRQRWPELRAQYGPAPVDAAPAAAAGDTAVAAAAREVLECGDPLQYFLDTFARDHVGDETLAHCLVMSIAAPSAQNSRGLHVYVTGESGKGKSSGMTAMLRQVPGEFRLAERMSDKALYYSDDIGPGTVLLLDDIELSEPMQEVLKEATSKFTEPVLMRTVDTERKLRHCAIPERCVWWLANVSTRYDTQVLNRLLTCWVDDSAAQDQEVFARLLADEARPVREAVRPRFDLDVCREIWRAVRAAGPVHVAVPFAEEIRMASVANRRNPLVLLDLVRSHALLFFRQRPSERLGDGTLAVTATGEDFEYAAGLFSALHAGGGSLGSKFDRDEDRLLAEAARREVEQFTIADVQRWTGWSYDKVYRMMKGYRGRGGTWRPGLLERSPALSLVDQTVVDPEGVDRDVRQRRMVFVFDAAIHRETMPRGDVWLEESPGADGDEGGCKSDARPDARCIEGHFGRETENGGCSMEIAGGICIMPEHAPAYPGRGEHRAPVTDASTENNNDESDVDRESERFPGEQVLASGLASLLHHADGCKLPGPGAFVPLDEPVPVPCAACGRRPSHRREFRGDRHLCRACHGAAVRREQRAGPPLPGTIDTEVLVPVTAPVGRCDVCGLEAAAFAGGGVRLCAACYDRETRREMREGGGAPAGHERRPGPGDPPSPRSLGRPPALQRPPGE